MKRLEEWPKPESQKIVVTLSDLIEVVACAKSCFGDIEKERKECYRYVQDWFNEKSTNQNK